MKEGLDMEQKEISNHTASYGTYIFAWVGLIIFTGLTVLFSGVSLGAPKIAVALLIASAKAGLVLSFFMHLKYEKRVFQIMFFLVVLILVIVFCFTFFDYPYR